MEGVEEDIDLETAQAQVDRAMAFTDSLVSGWMKASKAKLPSAASRGNNDFDLDEHMRRPPRLGLGASVPPSSSVHSHEASKLRSKLVGNGKKRAREDEHPTPGPSAIVISDDDDDDEGRARVITKKTRLDPFAAKSKKKATADPPISRAASSPTKVTAPPSKPKPTSKISDVEEIPRPEALASMTPKKRKKKKKHKAHAGAEPDVLPEAKEAPSQPPSPSHLRSNSPLQENGVSTATKPMAPRPKEREVVVIKDTLPPEPPRSQSLLSAALSSARSFFSKAVSSHSSISTPTNPSAQTSTSRPQPPIAKPVPPSPQRLDPFGNPLLNLDGPLPDVGDEPAGSTKKKRKRRRKKKKHAMTDPAAGMEVIDVDADDDGMDED